MYVKYQRFTGDLFLYEEWFLSSITVSKFYTGNVEMYNQEEEGCHKCADDCLLTVP